MAESSSHSRGIVNLVLCLLILPIALPLVGASSEWKEDGWLDADWFTKDGRIASGDELGCQGMPTLNLEFMPKTTAMECKKYSGLYFIGEVVDVTGHLGGHNFQWAWSSGYVASQNV